MQQQQPTKKELSLACFFAKAPTKPAKFEKSESVKIHPSYRELDRYGNIIVPLQSALQQQQQQQREDLTKSGKKEIKGGGICTNGQLAHQLLNLLRHFRLKPDYRFDCSCDEPSHAWDSSVALGNFQSLLFKLVEVTKSIVSKDKMLLSVPSPVYILGDIHGSYKDLEFFEKNFWNCGIDFTPSSFIFLGDFVDKGPHPVEVVSHLFALKILNPTQVFLIRGNHEFPSMNGNQTQHRYQFRDECRNILASETDGDRLWEAMNDCFDYLPISGIVDSKIFFTHGGIPRHILHSDNVLTDICNIKRPLKDSDVYGDPTFLALDLLWSDPINPEEEHQLNSSQGFGPNLQRGNNTSCFGLKAIDLFQEQTGCSALVRAHQPPNAATSAPAASAPTPTTPPSSYLSRGANNNNSRGGLSSRVVTVFSSSYYCGMHNSAGVAFVKKVEGGEHTVQVAFTEHKEPVGFY